MFDKLQEKWGVGPMQLVLILCTFAIGGSLSGFGAKKVMSVLALEKNALWWVIYIVVVTFLWPLCVLFVSIFFGQLKFFKFYLRKLGKKVGIISE